MKVKKFAFKKAKPATANEKQEEQEMEDDGNNNMDMAENIDIASEEEPEEALGNEFSNK